jgi:YD repeat-containing protein
MTNILHRKSAQATLSRCTCGSAGNRASVTLTNSGTVSYSANALNQYTNVGGLTPSYDTNGNRTALARAAEGSETARNQHGPFSEPLRVTGRVAKANPLR